MDLNCTGDINIPQRYKSLLKRLKIALKLILEGTLTRWYGGGISNLNSAQTIFSNCQCESNRVFDYICIMNSIGSDIPYNAVVWCWFNGIEVYSTPDENRKNYYKVIVDMENIDIKVSEGLYHLDVVDSKVWEIYVDIYLKAISN